MQVLKGEKQKVSSETEKVDTTDNENENQDEVLDENENDENFEVKRARKKKGDEKEKIDVMGKISLTCDEMNISVRDRTVISATVANALGVDLDKTNIVICKNGKSATQESSALDYSNKAVSKVETSDSIQSVTKTTGSASKKSSASENSDISFPERTVIYVRKRNSVTSAKRGCLSSNCMQCQTGQGKGKWF